MLGNRQANDGGSGGGGGSVGRVVIYFVLGELYDKMIKEHETQENTEKEN